MNPELLVSVLLKFTLTKALIQNLFFSPTSNHFKELFFKKIFFNCLSELIFHSVTLNSNKLVQWGDWIFKLVVFPLTFSLLLIVTTHALFSRTTSSVFNRLKTIAIWSALSPMSLWSLFFERYLILKQPGGTGRGEKSSFSFCFRPKWPKLPVLGDLLSGIQSVVNKEQNTLLITLNQKQPFGRWTIA